MGQLHAHRRPRRLRRGEPLILACGLALAGEIVVVALGDEERLVVNGEPASHGHEARDLPGGVYTVHVMRGVNLLHKHSVMLNATERVTLDFAAYPHERSRVRAPQRPPAEAEEAAAPSDEQAVIVRVARPETTRVWIDGAPPELDRWTGTWTAALPPGEHVVTASVDGRPRGRQTILVLTAPWVCAADALGGVACLEQAPLPDHLALIDGPTALAALRERPVHARVDELVALEGAWAAVTLAEVLTAIDGDPERLRALWAVRPRVVDPWNHGPLTAALRFPEHQAVVRALYAPITP